MCVHGRICMTVCSWARVHVNACMRKHVCSWACVYLCMTNTNLNRICDIDGSSVIVNASYIDTVILISGLTSKMYLSILNILIFFI